MYRDQPELAALASEMQREAEFALAQSPAPSPRLNGHEHPA